MTLIEATGAVRSTGPPSVGHAFEWAGDELDHTISIGNDSYRSTITIPRRHRTRDAGGDWWKAYLRGSMPQPAQERGSVRVLELFCGPGGLALGFRQACRELGFDLNSVGAVDQDLEALAVYRRHNATRTTRSESVSSLVDHRVEGSGAVCRFRYPPQMVAPEFAAMAGHVDVLLAGPPCQGHSNLNNRTRRSDKRNELYLTVPAIAVALGVRTVIIENVQAVLHDTKQVVQSTIALLEEAGYTVTSGVVKAASLGWAQRRDRFFLVACLDGQPVPLQALSTTFHHDAPRHVMWAIGDLRSAHPDQEMNLRPELSADNRRRIQWLFDNDAHDLDVAERPDCHKDGTTYNSVYGRMYGDRPAPTITTGFLTPGRGRYIHPEQPRVLTPREAARLQGFPDSYDFRLPDGSFPNKLKLTKWIGDAVPMPLGYIAGLSALGGFRV